MKVKELIEELKQYDPEEIVSLDIYDDGCVHELQIGQTYRWSDDGPAVPCAAITSLYETIEDLPTEDDLIGEEE